MNINLHPKGSKFILDVDLVEENVTFIHIYFLTVYINHTYNKILFKFNE